MVESNDINSSVSVFVAFPAVFLAAFLIACGDNNVLVTKYRLSQKVSLLIVAITLSTANQLS